VAFAYMKWGFLSSRIEGKRQRLHANAASAQHTQLSTPGAYAMSKVTVTAVLITSSRDCMQQTWHPLSSVHTTPAAA
jgi:hypothetical protein